MDPASTAAPLPVEVPDVPDLTNTLHPVRRSRPGQGSFGIVYHCFCKQNGEVAVKAINFPQGFDQADKEEFLRKMRREPGIWKRLDHPNIVPLLGKADGENFFSEHLCMVSMWMPNGTLAQYINNGDTVLSLPRRIQLIQGTASGLEYLHSRSIVHGDFHPGNILIDSDHNPRITDFGFSQTLSPQEQLTYLWTDSTRAGARKWVAPELLFRELFPDLKFEPTLNGDIYSLGSIILYIISGNPPWKDELDFESQIEQLKNPRRPPWPVIPDVLWDFIERCWSPKAPKSRPSAGEVLSFTTDRLEQLLQLSPASPINVVLFGAVGCGKSSIINLLAEEPIAPVSTNMEPCTKRPQCYQIPVGERQFRLWDTMGFCLPRGGAINHLSPYEQAHAVLRDLPDGVHIILLCAPKNEIHPWLRSLYWFINDFLFGGRAPVAFVVTHFDAPDKKWWESNHRTIIKKTSIPVESIPRACITTAQTSDYDQSRQVLRSLLENYATSVSPIPLRLNLSSQEAVSLLATNCGFPNSDATALVNRLNKPRNQLNVVLFGKAGSGKSSIVNLIARSPIAQVSSDVESCTLDSSSYTIDTPTKKFVIWDTVGFGGVRGGQDTTQQAVLNTVKLVRDLSAQSGIDLLVFVKNCRNPTASEPNCYRLLEEFLCEGNIPVAVVVTHLEDRVVMEQWWESNHDDLLKALSGKVIGHACITSLASHDHEESSEKLSESRLTVQALFEGCSSFSKGEEISVQLRTKGSEEGGRTPAKMTVENLVDHCGLTKELAKEVIRLYNGSG